MVQKRGLSMVQKRGVSMVQLFDFRQLFFGKGVSRWYNEIFKKILLVYMTGFLRGNNFVQKLGARGCKLSAYRGRCLYKTLKCKMRINKTLKRKNRGDYRHPPLYRNPVENVSNGRFVKSFLIFLSTKHLYYY